MPNNMYIDQYKSNHKMRNLHTLLQHQLESHLVPDVAGEYTIPDDLQPFLEEVSETYKQADAARLLTANGRLPGHPVAPEGRALAPIPESEIRFRTLVEGMAYGMIQADNNDVIQYVNNSFCEMLDYTLEEVVGQVAHLLLLRPEDQDALINKNQLRKEGVSDQYEVQLKKKSGELIWMQIGGSPLLDASGNIVGSVGIHTDLTERKRVEDALEGSLSMLRATLEATADGILVVDSKGAMVNYNRKFVDLWNIPDSILATDDPYMARSFVAAQLQDPEAFIRKIEELYMNPDAGSFDVLNLRSGKTFERYSKPQYIGASSAGRVWSFRDVTQLKRASEALKESESKYRMLIDHASDGIYLAARDGSLIDVNVKGCEMLGYTREEVLKLGINDIVDKGDLVTARENAEAIRSGKTVQAQRLMFTKGGATFLAEISSKLLPNGIYQGIVRDITERMEAEEALRNSEAKNRALVEAIPDLMIRLSRNGTILDFGAEKDDPLIASPDQFVGKSVYGILPAEIAETAIQYVEKTLACGKMQIFEYQLPVSNRTQHFEARLVESGENEVLAIIRNISERKQAQEALTKAKDDLELRVEERTAALRASNAELQRELTQREIIEHELQKKEAQLSEAQEIAHIGSWEADLKTLETRWSDELYRILGADPQAEKASRDAFREYIHPEDRWMLDKELKRVFAEGGSFAFDNRIVRHDGTIRTIHTRGKLLLNSEGQPYRIVGTDQDITELKLAEEALLQKTSALQAIFQAFPDLYFMIEADGTIFDYKAGHSGDLFVPPEAFLGKRVLDVLPPDAGRVCQDAILEVSASKSAVGVEYSLEMLDGKHYFEARLLPLLEEQIIIIIRDITGRKQAEHLLQESQTRYRAIVEDQTEIISRYLPDGTFTFVNEAHCEYWERTREELIGTSFLDIMAPEQRAYVEKHLLSFSQDKPIVTREQRTISLDGSVKWTHWTDRAFFDEQGKILEFQSVGSDVTERELAKEAAEAANLAKSEFLSRMSHELRTPLNAIIGFSQLLQMDELAPDQMESVELVHSAGRHLLDLINEVLEISRIEAGHMTHSLEPVSVTEVLSECLDLVKPLATDKSVRFKMDKGLLSTSYVKADRQRFKQIILNLFSNAVKYNRVGGSVSISCEELAGGALRISVSDTGAGIAQEQIPKLFTPFERLDADKTGVEGTGLGLALSLRLSRMMEGDIGMASTVGKGSTFWLDLPSASPLNLADEETGDVAQEPEKKAPAGKTVLYIEDNLSNLRLIEHIFQHWTDTKLISAMQGSLGFDLARKHAPDLILLDLHLPDVHGEKVLEWLRQEPSTSETPVIVITADATPREAARLLALGANDYITKPIGVKHFMGIIEDILEGKRPVLRPARNEHLDS